MNAITVARLARVRDDLVRVRQRATEARDIEALTVLIDDLHDMVLAAQDEAGAEDEAAPVPSIPTAAERHDGLMALLRDIALVPQMGVVS